MQNFVQPGKTIEFTNSTGSTIVAGTPVVIGNQVAILTDDVADGATGAADAEGVFYVPLTTSLAITKGDRIFWNASTGKATKTDSDTPMGIAWESQLANDATVNVKLMPAATSGVAATVAALTDNSGGATADGTIGVITPAAAITDNSGGTNATDTIAVLVDAGGTAAGAPTTASVANALKCLSTHENTNSTAITALRDAIKELATKQNAILTALKNAGLMA